MSYVINKKARLLVTGGTGLVGRALLNVLAEEGFNNVVAISTKDCNLCDGEAVARIFSDIAPDYLFHLAARVHGIGGNKKYKADILYDNIMINTNVIEQARRVGVEKIVAMGSGCVYPELKGQEELFENQVWEGPPHSSEDSYAHSKRLMLAQLEALREQYGVKSAFAISGNLYGPHDNFDVEEGHVIPALIAKFFEARNTGEPVQVWGSGVAVRDFSYCDDAARGLVEIMYKLEGPVNLGSGFRHSIRDIVEILQSIVGNAVTVQWDADKPDGQLQRYYNLDKLASTGFVPRVNLEDGIQKTYDWYVANWQIARKGYSKKS